MIKFLVDNPFGYLLQNPAPVNFGDIFSGFNNNLKIIYVIGCPRSGTTMLGKALGHASNAVWTEESLFQISLWQIFWDIHQGNNKKNFAPLQQYLTSIEMLELLGKFSSSIYNKISTNNKSKVIVEHTPWYGALVPYLATLFPKSRFVHIVRKKADVLFSLEQSYKKGYKWAGENVESRRYLYNRMIKLSRMGGLSLNNPQRFIEVSYEEICRKPYETLLDLCNFFSLGLNGEMLEALSIPHASPSRKNFVPAMTERSLL